MTNYDPFLPFPFLRTYGKSFLGSQTKKLGSTYDFRHPVTLFPTPTPPLYVSLKQYCGEVGELTRGGRSKGRERERRNFERKKRERVWCEEEKMDVGDERVIGGELTQKTYPVWSS